MVEGARLESVYTGNRIEGSNPSPSAILYGSIHGMVQFEPSIHFDHAVGLCPERDRRRIGFESLSLRHKSSLFDLPLNLL